ncbi:MAG: polyprenyl synthetase family protein [Candidatus Moranbacteria bacterium]|nr:polyprenyl synthetase family protein [Candidatus Moranbacteria bacterium]
MEPNGIGLREALLTDVKTGLSAFRDRINPLLREHFDTAIAEAAKEDELVAEAIGSVRDLVLAGGKRLRAALMCAGYFAAGGTDEQRILRTSMSVEFVHAFLLVHDDVIDRDDLRHGTETVHARYARYGKSVFHRPEDAAHFGDSVAIIVGDLVAALGNDLVFRSGFPNERVFRALSELQRIVSYTVIGQAMDLSFEFRSGIGREDVLRMYEYKTAKYTVEGPLVLGALLAGGDEELIAALRSYAVPIGVAFQIRDDILGAFGTEEKLGKPVGSDVEEGKRTLPVLFALERASKVQRAGLERILSAGSVDADDLERFRSILRDTGALDLTTDSMLELVREGKRPIASPRVPEDARRFLVSMADYISERNF